MISIECAWEQRVHWAACHSFYCGYRAAVKVLTAVEGVSTFDMVPHTLLLEYHLGYTKSYEGHTDLAPYEFFECCNEKSDDEILGAAVQHYDVVEIDDGIKPAFFYKTEHGYELLFSFDAKTAKKNIREEID